MGANQRQWHCEEASKELQTGSSFWRMGHVLSKIID
jgi:hypothetical protein